jgi:hypothetical protein
MKLHKPKETAPVSSNKRRAVEAFIWVAALVPLLLFLSLLLSLSYSYNSRTPVTVENKATTVPSSSPTPNSRERLVLAKNAIQLKDFTQAQGQLSQIPQSAPDYREANALREWTLKELRKQEDAARVRDRKKYARDLEEFYLMQGRDVYLTVSGKNADTITVRYELMSRPWAYDYINIQRLDQEFAREGFKRAILTGPYFRWEINL